MGGVSCVPVSRADFRANREIYREFANFVQAMAASVLKDYRIHVSSVTLLPNSEPHRTGNYLPNIRELLFLILRLPDISDTRFHGNGLAGLTAVGG